MKRGQPTKRRPSPRIQEKRRQARRDILQAAQDIVREDGIEAVTLESVAGALGMTRQALYHYFPSKEALVRGVVVQFVDEEVEVLIAAVEAADAGENTLGTMIRAYYDHYIDNLEVFRAIYCQTQLYEASHTAMDEETVRDEINPRTRHLFDILEQRLSRRGMKPARRQRLRRLAFTAWTSALGLVTMLGVADALNDPLVHSDEDLLDTLQRLFDEAAVSQK